MTEAVATATDRLALFETFVRIVEAGSLSAAALQLGSTQPTISRRLQALERALGVRLVQRTTHHMTVTDDGARCYDRAKELLAQVAAFESEIRGAGDEPVGTLRVVVPHAFGQDQLVAPLARFLAAHPRLAVEWSLHDRTPDFSSDNVDCAIHVGEVRDPSVIAQHLGDVPRIVVASPAILPRARSRSRAVTHPSELAKLPWIALRTFYRDEVALTHTATGEVARFPIAPRLATDSLYATRAAAVLGVGAAIASTWVLGDELARGALVHLAPAWRAVPLPVYLVYPPARFYPARLRSFIAVMRAAMPAIEGVAARPVRVSSRHGHLG